MSRGLSAVGEAQPLEPTPLSAAVDHLASHPDARARLLARLKTTREPEERARILHLLAFVGTSDVDGAALRMLESDDPAQRSDGFTLAQHFRSRAFEQRLDAALAHESDPRVLNAALQAVDGSMRRSTAERAERAARLRTLGAYPDANVRAASLTALARSDRSAPSASAILRALDDGDATVKRAALSALAETGDASDAAKQKLLALVRDPTLDEALRTHTLDVLDGYALDGEELALLRDEVGGLE